MTTEPTTQPPAGDPPPPADDKGPDPWERLGTIVEDKVKSVFAGHVADHHTAPQTDEKGTKKSEGTPPAGVEGDKNAPKTADDRGFLAKAFGFK